MSSPQDQVSDFIVNKAYFGKTQSYVQIETKATMLW